MPVVLYSYWAHHVIFLQKLYFSKFNVNNHKAEPDRKSLLVSYANWCLARLAGYIASYMLYCGLLAASHVVRYL